MKSSLLFATASVGLALALTTCPVLAQTPTLEFFAGAGNPTGSGPVVDSQTITLQNNADNPSASTPTAYSPTTTVTYTLSDEVYAPATGRQGVMFGGQTNTGGTTPTANAIFPLMNAISGSANTHYTSGRAAGSGIDITANHSVELATDVQYAASSTAAGRLPYATLTLTFSRALVDPVLHVTGLGTPSSGGGTVAATTEFDVLTSGVTLSKLSGSGEFSVTATSINNSSTAPTSSTGSGAASGSVRVITPAGGITQLQLRIYLRKLAGTLRADYSYTDGWLLGVSQLTANTPLPVTLVSFTVQAASATAAQLTWVTASEKNNDYFEVERSLDGETFAAIGRVTGQGSKTTRTDYTYLDASAGTMATGPVYYRLRQVDLDGTATYSPVRAVAFAAVAPTATWQLAPNPASGGTTTLDLSSLPAADYQLQVLNATGQVLLKQAVAGGQATDLSLAGLPAGTYLVRLLGATAAATPAQRSQRLQVW